MGQLDGLVPAKTLDYFIGNVKLEEPRILGYEIADRHVVATDLLVKAFHTQSFVLSQVSVLREVGKLQSERFGLGNTLATGFMTVLTLLGPS